MPLEVLQPPGWARPKGYANGIAGEGRLVFTAPATGPGSSGSFVLLVPYAGGAAYRLDVGATQFCVWRRR